MDEWVNRVADDLLDVPHLHVTLTTDDLLRPFFHTDRSLLKVLLKTAAQAVRGLVADLCLDVRSGLVYTVHTFGRDLGFKPLPAARLSAKWRYLLRKHLREARPHNYRLRQAIAKGYRDRRGYQVHTDSFYPRGLDAARYIGRYLDHPPLATSHLIGCDGQQVSYWYTDTYTGEHTTVTCSALDFISRLIPHIPPKGAQIVRYAGLYARNVKRKYAAIARIALEALRLQFPLFNLQSLTTAFQHTKWRERIKKGFGYDPLRCPRCGRTRELAEIWEPKREHIWMKRWLETHRLQKPPAWPCDGFGRHALSVITSSLSISTPDTYPSLSSCLST